MRNVRIVGTGRSHRRASDNAEQDQENLLTLAVEAAERALAAAGYGSDAVECLVACGASSEAQIPCTAALIAQHLNHRSPIPCMDIDSACTSFITALDVMSRLIEDGCYQKVLIVAMTSGGGISGGNGAVALVVECCLDGESSILHSMQLSQSEGLDPRSLVGCFSRDGSVKDCGACGFSPHERPQGRSLLRERVEALLAGSALSVETIDKVILRGSLGSGPEGSLVGSVPYALCEAIESGGIRRGDRVLLLGTAGNLTLNVLVLDY